MLKAHKVSVYPEDGGGFKWCLLDPETGEFMHGGKDEPVFNVIECWNRSHPAGDPLKGTGAVEVDLDAAPIGPLDFARMVMAARPRGSAKRKGRVK